MPRGSSAPSRRERDRGAPLPRLAHAYSIHTHIYIYIYTYAYPLIPLVHRREANLAGRVHWYMYLYIYIYMYIYKYISIYINTHITIYIYTRTHIYTYPLVSFTDERRVMPRGSPPASRRERDRGAPLPRLAHAHSAAARPDLRLGAPKHEGVRSRRVNWESARGALRPRPASG